MNNTEYVVFWMECGAHMIPRGEVVDDMGKALARCAALRTLVDVSHVCMSSRNRDSIGRPGVDSVKNGKLPDGEDYTWVMRRNGDVR